MSPLTVAPDDTISIAPLPIVVARAMPPDRMNSWPAAASVWLVALPPEKICTISPIACVPPLRL
jgi:hypothetical protein